MDDYAKTYLGLVRKQNITKIIEANGGDGFYIHVSGYGSKEEPLTIYLDARSEPDYNYSVECVDGVITYPDGECEPYKQIAEALVAADFTNWEIISDNG